MADETTGADNFPQSYIRFRTVLDALELTAMRYFLKDTDDAKRIERAQEFEKLLLPIITKYQNKASSASNNEMSSASMQAECPDGFYNCGGCCSAYPCP